MLRQCFLIGLIKTKRVYDSSDSFHPKTFLAESRALGKNCPSLFSHRVDNNNSPTSKFLFCLPHAYSSRDFEINTLFVNESSYFL